MPLVKSVTVDSVQMLVLEFLSSPQMAGVIADYMCSTMETADLNKD